MSGVRVRIFSYPLSQQTEMEHLQRIAGLPLRTAVAYGFLFVIAFVFYTAVWTTAPIMVSDSPTYTTAAESLSNLQLSQSRTPGYPLLLVLTGSTRTPTRELFFVSLLLHFISIWLLARILYVAALPETMLILFCAILLLPPYVEPAAYVLSENLAEILLVSGFASLVFWLRDHRKLFIVISALALGYAGLTRPTYQIVAPAMAAALIATPLLFRSLPLARTDVIKGGVSLVLGSILVLGGYAYLNYKTFGYFGVSPKLGLSLSTKTWRVVERLPDRYAPIRGVLITARDSQLVEVSDHDGSMSVWAAVPGLMRVTGLDFADLSTYMFKVNLRLIVDAPLHYLREIIWAFGSYLFPSSTMLANFDSRIVQSLWTVLHVTILAGFMLSLVLVFGGVVFLKACGQFGSAHPGTLRLQFRSIESHATTYGLAATIVFYTAVVSCLIEVGDPRYRVCTDSLIVFMIFLGTRLWRQLLALVNSIVAGRAEVPAPASFTSIRVAQATPPIR